ncbi:Cytochrome P450 monooxygenase virE [Cladobotryum mycophilum]|uniref:Cytochrome P450 monooxygenase virE n=1 Tax=Cladobotryum mycophilum TaxID=491253 RepID=A0ABR0SHA5_9HYPO
MISEYLPSIVAILATGLLIRQIFTSKISVPKGSRLPPGPRGWLLVGNLPDIPPFHSWLKFKEWGDRYGPLFRLNIAGREHYVVSSEKVANDLLRERGSIYSSREQLPAAAVLLSGNLRPLLLPYNDVWRKGRRLMHLLTMPSATTKYQPTQALESVRLINDLVQTPENYEKLFQRYSSSLIFRLAFGKVIASENDQFRLRILDIVHNVERVASPGTYLVDTFPWLMHLPDFMAPFKRELKALHENERGLFRELLDGVRQQMDEGTAPDCWERTFLEHQEEYKLTADEGAYVIGTLFEAGSTTTAAAMMCWLHAVVEHPEWFKRVQDEVDSVVGSDRLPEFEDLASLPTVRATVKETMRWRPVTAGGFPHQLVKDDVYKGHFIPAGTNIHPNQWAIHRDVELYPNPEAFRPERWLEPAYLTYREPLSIYPNLQNYSCFGFGRRICPGQHIAERSLHLLSMRIAWACSLSKEKDRNGEFISIPPYDYTKGFNVQPNPFHFELKARSEERLRLVMEALVKGKASDPLGKLW